MLFTYTRIILYNTSKPPGSVVPMFLGCVWRSKMQRAYCNSRIWHPWRGSLLVGHSILIWFFYCTLQIEAITSKKSSLLNDCVEANPRLCSFIHSRKNMDTCWRTALESRNQRLARVQEFKTIFTRVALEVWNQNGTKNCAVSKVPGICCLGQAEFTCLMGGRIVSSFERFLDL